MKFTRINIAKKLYKKYENYSEVARQLGVAPETIRLTLNKRARKMQIDRDKKRDWHGYYTDKKKNDPEWYKQSCERATKRRHTPEGKERSHKQYLKAKRKGQTGYKGLTAAQLAHIERRRGKKLSLKENYTDEDMAYTRNLFKNKCAICNKTKNLCFDHWYPLSKGFPLSRKNSVLLCRSCNAMKYDRLPHEHFSENIVNRIERLLHHSQAN